MTFFGPISEPLRLLATAAERLTASGIFFFPSADEEELLIERSARTGMLNPGDPWQTFIHDGAVGHIVYKVRVRCDEHYYSSKCNKLCVPRDDYFGHYRCEASGAQVCLDGWMGPDCRTGTLTTPSFIFNSDNLTFRIISFNSRTSKRWEKEHVVSAF